jgi:hypothetical protein
MLARGDERNDRVRSYTPCPYPGSSDGSPGSTGAGPGGEAGVVRGGGVRGCIGTTVAVDGPRSAEAFALPCCGCRAGSIFRSSKSKKAITWLGDGLGLSFSLSLFRLHHPLRVGTRMPTLIRTRLTSSDTREAGAADDIDLSRKPESSTEVKPTFSAHRTGTRDRQHRALPRRPRHRGCGKDDTACHARAPRGDGATRSARPRCHRLSVIT